ncbi:cadherin-related family member 1-like isoform X2 [Ptychodera flava]
MCKCEPEMDVTVRNGLRLRASLLLLLFYIEICTVYANFPPEFVPIPNTNPRKYYDMDKEQFPEDTQTNIAIYTLIATDPDDDCVRFAIKDGEGDDFFKLADEGNCTHVDVQLRQSLDYEENTRHTITWELSDGVNVEVPTTVTVYVIDVNDNAPEFIDTPSEVEVDEHEDVGTIILKVTATDADSGSNGMGTLDLVEEQGWNGTFHLTDYGDWTGDVFLISGLNYEMKTQYGLLLIATDRGTNPGPLTSTMSVTVLVLDNQDMPPVWIGEPYICTAYDTMAVNTTIITVTARDGDRAAPNEVVYLLSNDTGNSTIDGYFDVHLYSGAVYIKEELHPLLYGVWNLTILAVEVDPDQTWEMKSSATDVEITITAGPTPTPQIIDFTETYIATFTTLIIFAIVAFFILALCVHNDDDPKLVFRKRKVYPADETDEPTKKEQAEIPDKTDTSVCQTNGQGFTSIDPTNEHYM